MFRKRKKLVKEPKKFSRRKEDKAGSEPVLKEEYSKSLVRGVHVLRVNPGTVFVCYDHK